MCPTSNMNRWYWRGCQAVQLLKEIELLLVGGSLSCNCWRQSILMQLVCSSDAHVGEAVALHLVRAVDVAQVHHHRGGQCRLEAAQVQGAERVPLGHEHQGIRIAGAV